MSNLHQDTEGALRFLDRMYQEFMNTSPMRNGNVGPIWWRSGRTDFHWDEALRMSGWGLDGYNKCWWHPNHDFKIIVAKAKISVDVWFVRLQPSVKEETK